MLISHRDRPKLMVIWHRAVEMPNMVIRFCLSLGFIEMGAWLLRWNNEV
jgi:hypothetical protein